MNPGRQPEPDTAPLSQSRPMVKVLLVEDNPGDVRLIQEIIRGQAAGEFELEWVGVLASALDRLRRDAIDVVLLDLSLPDSRGFETFATLQAQAPHTAIIVLSGLDDDALAIRAVQAGAQDYLVKGQVDGRLLTRIMRYAVERKRAREALAREQDLLHNLMDSIPDRIYFKDHQSRFTRINRAMSQMFGLAHPKEAIGKSDADFFSPEHAASALADERRIMETGQPLIGKIEKVAVASGQVGWAFTTKVPWRDTRGRIAGTFGISRDITALKQMEDDLAEERTLLRSLIDSSPDHVYAKDRDGKFLVANKAVADFFQAGSPEELVGKTDFDLLPRGLAEQFRAEEQALIRSIHPRIDREAAVIDPEGRTRWVLTTKVLLRDSRGQIIGTVGVNHEITYRKEAEDRQRQLNDDLVRNQTRLIHTLEKLQQANEELKETHLQLIQMEKMEVVGRLAAGVAHEVKNPLAIALLGVEYLEQAKTFDDPNVPMVIQEITGAIARADAIVRGLVDFSAVSKLDLVRVDLNAIVEGSLLLFRFDLIRHSIEVTRELAEALPPVCVDRAKMEQVFVNLISNAIDAMPQGGTLAVRTSAQRLAVDMERDLGDRTGQRLRAGDLVVTAEVDDTGGGILPEHLPKVFEPFFTTKPTGKGTGLGLAVAKKIIDLQGGAIEVRNRAGGGVRVAIMLPAVPLSIGSAP